MSASLKVRPTIAKRDGPVKGIVSTMITALGVSQQMWLPLDRVRQANVHEYARRAGIKVRTRTIVRSGVKGVVIQRIDATPERLPETPVTEALGSFRGAVDLFQRQAKPRQERRK
jgi:hypothetical protein